MLGECEETQQMDDRNAKKDSNPSFGHDLNGGEAAAEEVVDTRVETGETQTQCDSGESDDSKARSEELDADAESTDSKSMKSGLMPRARDEEADSDATQELEDECMGGHVAGDGSGHESVIDGDTNDKEVTSSHVNAVKDEVNLALSQKMREVRVSEKWGEYSGVYDDRSCKKRVIALHELHNYVKLQLKKDSNFRFFFALINDRYPRFFRKGYNGRQRWRMRYNVFVDSVFQEEAVDMLLHVGEIHMYFDVIPRMRQPYYINYSFYNDYQQSELTLDSELVLSMKRKLKAICHSKELHQLKFPFSESAFEACNELYDKFLSRQTEIIKEAEMINDRYVEKYGEDRPRSRNRSRNRNRGRRYSYNQGNRNNQTNRRESGSQAFNDRQTLGYNVVGLDYDKLESDMERNRNDANTDEGRGLPRKLYQDQTGPRHYGPTVFKRNSRRQGNDGSFGSFKGNRLQNRSEDSHFGTNDFNTKSTGERGKRRSQRSAKMRSNERNGGRFDERNHVGYYPGAPFGGENTNDSHQRDYRSSSKNYFSTRSRYPSNMDQ